MSTYEEILDEYGVLTNTCVGTSMMPLLRQRRDLMVIRPQSGRLHWLDCPLFKRKNGQYILHRVMWVRKHDYLICGDNQWRWEKGVTDDQILGVLVEVQRDGKPLKMDSAKMKIYGFLQFVFYPLRALLLIGKAAPSAIKRRIQRHNHTQPTA